MTAPTPPSLTLLAAFDLLRNKKPAELTAEEVAGLRARLQASPPALFASVGGTVAVERYLAEAEEALVASASQAVSDRQEAAKAAAAGTPADRRSTRRKIELVLYAVVVVAAAGGLYFFLRGGEEPPAQTAKKTEQGPGGKKTLPAVQPTGATAGKKIQPPPADEKPPVVEPPDPNGWLGWKIVRSKDGTAEQQDDWDHSDPSNPVPAKALRVYGAPLRLTRSVAIGAEDKWLLVFALPLTAGYPGGQIAVNIDGKEVAKASIGAGESDWPLYVPLTDSQQAKRQLEIVFTPGTPQQKIVFWNAKLVGSQTKKPLPESPLIVALRSQDSAVRAQGATAAGQVVDPLVLGALIRVLGDSNREVRKAAVVTLAKYNIPPQSFVVDALVLKLRDADPEVRRLAAQTLMSFDTDSTWVALTQTMTTHPDTQLRLQIAQQLTGRTHPVVRPAFEKLLDGVDDPLRVAAVNSLAGIPDPGATALLVKAIGDPEPGVRRAAAAALVGRRDSAAEAALITALTSHPDMQVRRTALTRFQQVPSVKALPAIRSAMESPDDQLRRLAPQALTKLPVPEVDAMLVDLINSADPAVRAQIAEALWNRPGTAAEDLMLKILASGQEPALRQVALRRFSTPALVTPRVIPALLEAAKSPSATTRLEIVEAIRAIRFAQLQYSMQHGKTRSQAIEVLGTAPWSDTFALAVQLLDDPVPRVRLGAAGVLSADQHPAANAIMLRLLASPDAQIRQMGAGRFPQFAMPTADVVELCLKDPDAQVRAHAVTALTRIRTREAAALLAKSFDDPAVTVRQIVQTARLRNPADVQDDALLPAAAKVGGPQEVPILVNLLNDPKPSIRQAAAQRLRQNPSDAADQALNQAIKSHSDIFVRRVAAQNLLRKPPTPAVIELAGELLRSPDPETRETALSVLSRAPTPQTISLMATLLSDPVPKVSLTAATLLCAIPPPMAEDAVIPLLNHPDWQIRQQAVQRFTRAPSPRAINGLGQAVAAPEREIRVEALRALAQINDPAVIPILGRALDDPDEQVRMVAVELLRGRGDPASIATMLNALASHPSASIRQHAAAKYEVQPSPAALGPLTAAAKHEDDALRSVALRALGKLAEPAATAAIVEALSDPVPEVRLTAATVLVTRRDDASEAAMITALNSHGDVEVRRLAASRFHHIPTPKAVPALAEAMKNVDDQLRLVAVQGLQKTPAEAIDPLIAGLSDPSDSVRQVALAALGPQGDPKAKAAVAAYNAKLQGGSEREQH
ncbi:MAG: HEAT repeat domain-containing protein [Planctomycetes bacterium]|nr:HEAT repeat domain-containing protein [Planctomycetota bacterium]